MGIRDSQIMQNMAQEVNMLDHENKLNAQRHATAKQRLWGENRFLYLFGNISDHFFIVYFFVKITRAAAPAKCSDC